ncbi:hypothetical protein C3L33_15258, partial [Rhododendron williamsianum]
MESYISSANPNVFGAFRFRVFGFRPRLHVLHCHFLWREWSSFLWSKTGWDSSCVLLWLKCSYNLCNSTPFRFYGLTAGNGFVCGLLIVQTNPIVGEAVGLLKWVFPNPWLTGPNMGNQRRRPPLMWVEETLDGEAKKHLFVDCWGYNMTANHVFDGKIQSISAEEHSTAQWSEGLAIAAGDYFTCGVLAEGSLFPFVGVLVSFLSPNGGLSRTFVVSLTAIFFVRYKLRNCRCSDSDLKPKGKSGNVSSFQKDSGKIRPDLDDIKIRRAQMFTMRSSREPLADSKKNPKWERAIESRPFAQLLGYCEEGGERLLVYEYMANGSLHQHLHGKNKASKEQLDWSSNILIDEEHNARVADFGLSLLGPANSSSPLAELPAGTLGYLDPEYYRLHYLTTKSDVYSFGVLLLEILSGRKAIDMQFEEGNIVEWAVPLIKAGDIQAILDPVLKPPSDIEALKRIANVASLALLMGSPSNDQPILPTEVVLGSSRMHKKSSQRSSNRSASETEVVENEDQRFEFRAPSWITFPSVTSSQRRKSSVSEADVDPKTVELRNLGNGGSNCDGLRSLEEEMDPLLLKKTCSCSITSSDSRHHLRLKKIAAKYA